MSEVTTPNSTFSNPEVDVEKEVDQYCLNRSEDGLMMYESVPFSGVSVSHYENGQLRSKTSYSNGKRDGIHEWYYNHGQLMTKGFFSNDVPCGEWVEFEETVTYPSSSKSLRNRSRTS